MSTQSATPSLFEKIQKVNAALLSFGVEAIQEIHMKDEEGNTVGRIKYGFKPQYVFDAVNEHVGAENWRYEVVNIEQSGKQMIATVDLFMRVGDEWLSKGLQVGHMNVIKNNFGDAKKGAITAAIQKGMSLCSIGSDAFKGKLEDVWRKASRPGQKNQQPAQQGQGQQRRQPSPSPQKPPESSAGSSSQQPSQNQASGSQGKPASQGQPASQTPTPPAVDGLPAIDGITYKQEDGFVEAQGDKSLLYAKRQMLSMAGFVYTSKLWRKAIAA